ncbi:MAG: bifunctional nuclease family protein [Paludibacteraceae bacterium]|nr:bifunctional nuclease family protein [Paludibacteraceae bacterium]
MAYKQIRVYNIYPTEEDSYLLAIEEIESHQKFGILTLKNEAMYILSFIFEKYPPRPSLYEVFSNYLKENNVIISEIHITQYKQNIYYAELICKENDTIKKIDIKASDAIALAYLNKTSLYAEEQVILECCQRYQRILKKFEEKYSKNIFEQQNESCAFGISKIDLYKQKLKQAIDTENYELAAKLKKEIDQISNQ